MHAYIIAGSSKEERDLFIQSMLKDWKVAKFDQIWLTKPDDKDSIGISLVKEWQKQCQLTPIGSSQLTGIINDADTLTVEAQNALLKSLEDPPATTIFILSAQQISVFLPTIVSRCQILKVPQAASPVPADFTQIEKQIMILTDQNHSSGYRINYLESIIADKSTAQKWIDSALQFSQKNLEDNPLVMAAFSKKLLHVLQLLKANVSYKLAIDRIILP